MITKMTKYSFIVFHQEVATFLSKVQELGMVDITRENKAVDAHSREMFDLTGRYAASIKSLSALKESLAEVTASELPVNSTSSPEETLLLAEKLMENRELWSADEKSLLREREEALPWGQFNLNDIKKIEELGFTLHFYAISETNFNEDWDKEHILQIISRDKGKCYFAILVPKNQD
jgi:V/A-type H+-transporting ATPase subunit I